MIKLTNIGILNGEQFEAVLDRLTLSGQRMITTEQVKLVVSAVMFNEFGDTNRSLINDISSDRSFHIH